MEFIFPFTDREASRYWIEDKFNFYFDCDAIIVKIESDEASL